jgi:hypothetical protein
MLLFLSVLSFSAVEYVVTALRRSTKEVLMTEKNTFENSLLSSAFAVTGAFGASLVASAVLS